MELNTTAQATASQITNTLPTESADLSQALGQEDFLRLMVAQVQNQDPFAPMENGDFIGQMAQFSSVDGINKISESMETMTSAFSQGQSLQAASLVGRQVVAPTDTATLTAGNPVTGEVNLTSGVSSLAIDIKDVAGVVVKSIDLGAQAAGRIAYSWNGMGDDGSQQLNGEYTVAASGSVAGEETSFSTLMPVQVSSVSLGGAMQTPQLYLANGTNIGLDKVEQIH